MRAKLIGDKSKGLTAVEIYDNKDTLVWSHMWKGVDYADSLCAVYGEMVYCDIYDIYEESDNYQYSAGDTTGVMLEYSNGQWTLSDDWRQYGQSYELIDAMMHIGILPSDDRHSEIMAVDSDRVKAIKKIADCIILPF